ncbi:helix-turn-helix domain-containing protein [Edwardsiella tarda]|nr:helix-turn-helix domain-containing protein [Edwardsiella tarda]
MHFYFFLKTLHFVGLISSDECADITNDDRKTTNSLEVFSMNTLTKSLTVHTIEDINQWVVFLKENTYCGDIQLFTPEHLDFYGEVNLSITPDKGTIMNVFSTPSSVVKNERSNDVFALIYMDTPLYCVYRDKLIEGAGKDTLLVNGGNPFTLGSKYLRHSTTVIFTLSQLGSNNASITTLFDGRMASTLQFGSLINKVMAEISSQHAQREKLQILIDILNLSTGSAKRYHSSRFNKLCALIQQNSHLDDFSLKDLVDLSGLSLRTIQYIFSREQTRFKDLITKFRIEVVQQQIRSDPARPLQDIVVNSGFRSVYAASRLFHRKYGESLFDYYAKYKL